MALLDIRRYDEAADALGTLLAAVPQHPSGLILLSFTRLRQGQPGEAVTLADSAVAVAPNNAEAHRVRAEALMAVERQVDAEGAARDAVRADPESSLAFETLARVLGATKRLEQGLWMAQRAVELDTERVSAHVTYAHLLWRTRRPTAAARAFGHILSLQPDNAEAQKGLAGLDLQKGRWRRALRGLAVAASLDPRDTQPALMICRLLWILIVVLGFALVPSMLAAMATSAQPDPWVVGLGRMAAAGGVLGELAVVVYVVIAMPRRIRPVIGTLRRTHRALTAAAVALAVVELMLTAYVVWPIGVWLAFGIAAGLIGVLAALVELGSWP